MVWRERLLRRFYPVSGLPVVTHHRLSLPHFPPALAGFRLLQLSDLHLDFWNLPGVEAAIAQVALLRPDMIVLTGDFIARGSHWLETLQTLLADLHAPWGVWACMGNHDYDDGDSGDAVIHALGKANVQVLRGDIITLRPKGYALQMVGLDDWCQGRPPVYPVWTNLAPETPTICLAHNPRHFLSVSTNPCSTEILMLSGHTHGGQIGLLAPWIRRYSPFIAGHYPQAGNQLYVHRGVGSAILADERHGLRIPTIRWQVRPEVAVFECHPRPVQ
jgi:predicted MPP superfamily phosphohydrolase